MPQLTAEQIYILLVEPSCAQQKIIGKYLGELGIGQRNWVKTGEQALTSMRMNTPDLVISAMHLQDMTGTELVQTMRAAHDLHSGSS